ncbi:MAG TPA: kelch repeat-containing protein, partial [Gammaproteobacteria bacterium]|nr:kelch repeat-containing protein [Gammaproteobacteria bacterium]
IDGEILIFGGESTRGTFDDVEGYDPRADRWSPHPPMPTPRHGLGAAVLNGRVYVIGGGPTPGGSYSSANEVYTPRN